MATDLQVRVDGRWLTSIAPWGELEYSWLADGGCEEASWRMPVPRDYRHPSLVRGKDVEVRLGPLNTWRGRLTEPDQDDEGWTFHAAGLKDAAGNGGTSRGFMAFDAAINNTSIPNTAIDQAIARGLPWIRPASLSGVAFVDAGSVDAIVTVSELLDRWSASVSKRWGVNAEAEVYAAADPTVPMWHMTPGSGSYGYAEEEYASDVYLRYYNTSFVLATAHAQDADAADLLGVSEAAIDGRDYGALTAPKAVSYAQGLLDKGKARLAWTNAVTPSRWQLTTPGGAPACLALVKAQQMVRLHGLRDVQGTPIPYVDFVIGRTRYTAESDTMVLEPVGLAPRNLADVLAATASAS